MNRIVMSCAMLVLLAQLNGQKLVEETSSNFVNFNLNRINMVRSYLPHINGRGLVASIKEFPYDTLDIDFAGRHIPYLPPPDRPTPHATLMATILAGGGNSFFNGLGVAWQARLTSSSFLNIFPDDNSYFEDLGISVQNHSYGIDSIENFYGPIAGAYDLQLSQLPEILHVFSIGNFGVEAPTTGPYAGLSGFANMSGEFKLAKNILTVGVVDSFSVIDPFSSRGPAFDGRIKPELVAFGIDGASAAAALASGSALLLQQAYLEREGELPPAALVKALLINGATDLGAKGIDYTYGFGNIDIYRSLKTLLAGRYINDTLRFDETKSYFLEIPEGVTECKITMAWADPPAAVYAEKALVNDLDMEIIRVQDGAQWFPQRLSIFPHPDSLSRPAITGKDHINNLEQIVLHQPAAGNYEIRVAAFEFGVAGQAFHLAYEWDTLPDFQWLYPTRNNFVAPSDLFFNQLYWRSSNEPAQGKLSLSLDGGNWQTIGEAVALQDHSLQWSPPDTVSNAQLRMQIAGEDFLSDTFVISSPPKLQVVLNCPDSLAIQWTKQPGIDQYRVYHLNGPYLQPLFQTADTFAVIQKEELSDNYVALAPVLNDGREGLRSLAYNTEQQSASCYFLDFYGELSGEEAHLFLNLSLTYGVKELILERFVQGRWVSRQAISGSIDQNPFEFVDTDLERGNNTYRVVLQLENGQALVSAPVEIYYLPPDQFVIFPNPLSRTPGESIQVHYNVPEPEKVLFQLYTAHGAQVIDLPLNDLITAVFADDFPPGMYFYRFVREGKLLQSGKLVVR